MAIPREDFTSGGGIPLFGETIQSWRITELIGMGGMGTVYKAVHDDIGHNVAVKILASKYADDPDQVQRFVSEARMIARIYHPNVADVFDVGELPDGRPYFVMELIEGPSLARLLTEAPLPSIEWAVEMAEGVLAGLGAAHTQGILHRDVKPANILIGPGGVKLVDFGVAKLVREIGSHALKVTTFGALVGTPAYLPSEQVDGNAEERSDLYAVAVVLYETLTGRLPFEGATLLEMLRMHQQDTPLPPSRHRPDIPPALDAVILRGLAKSPADRFHSASEMASALRHALSVQGWVDMATPTPAPVPRAQTAIPRGRPMRWIAALALFGVALAGALVVVQQARRDDVQRDPGAVPAPAAESAPAPAAETAPAPPLVPTTASAPETAPEPAAAPEPAPEPEPEVAPPTPAEAIAQAPDPEPEPVAATKAPAKKPATATARRRARAKGRASARATTAERRPQAKRPAPPKDPETTQRYLDLDDI